MISNNGGGGSGVGINLPDEHIFANETERDAAIPTPYHLQQCAVASGKPEYHLLQEYRYDTWVDVSYIIRGPKGNTGLQGNDGKDGVDGKDGEKGDSFLTVNEVPNVSELVFSEKFNIIETKSGSLNIDVKPNIESLNVVAGVYDSEEQLKNRYPTPFKGMTAIVRDNPADLYYVEKDDIWVENGAVNSVHQRYIGAFSDLMGLPDATNYNDGDVCIIYMHNKENIIQTFVVISGKWEILTSGLTVKDINSEIDENDICTITIETFSGIQHKTSFQLKAGTPQPPSDKFLVLHFWCNSTNAEINDVDYAKKGGNEDELTLTNNVSFLDFDEINYSMKRNESSFKYPFFAIPKSSGISLTAFNLEFLYSYDWVEKEVTDSAGVTWKTYTGPNKNNEIFFENCKIKGVKV